MLIRYFIRARAQARTPGPRERVLVASGDPNFWLALRQESDGLDATWLLANSARECLMAVEDSRVKLAILDGTLNDKPANQLLPLLRQIRPDLQIVFAYDCPREDWEVEARQAGVLYYCDRNHLGSMLNVVRQTLQKLARPGRPRTGRG